MNPQNLVFIDETGATTNMARRYGRAMRGERLTMSVPFGHWKTTTFLAGLRHDRIDAPCGIDGVATMCLVAAALGIAACPVGRVGDDVVDAAGVIEGFVGAGAVNLGRGIE